MSKKGMKWSRQGDAVDFCCKDKAKKNKKQCYLKLGAKY